jgi:hypothetical protein
LVKNDCKKRSQKMWWVVILMSLSKHWWQKKLIKPFQSLLMGFEVVPASACPTRWA